MSRVLGQRCARQLLPRARAATGRRTYAAAAAAPAFDWQDPLSSKSLLTEEEQAISETAERYCQEQLAPRVLRTLLLI